MQEELDQFTRNDVWYLVPRPKDSNVIGTKWVFRNKIDENGVITRNKARLVAQGYTQVKGVDFDETFAPVARLESVRLLLAIACHLSVGVCARFQANPKESHLNAVKRIIRYVSGTPTLGIYYSFDSNYEIAGYTDADWVGNVDDRKSTSRGCFYVGNNLVSWHSKKQACLQPKQNTSLPEVVAHNYYG
ncbi:hypothetical protein L3X38_025516 [Prunus dulcis]|uniref:Reverse transcriptase Ty1/copia-type domain-containing protein n=1 Tax=Prunus dulcis TaxID=3755 RepID=A0AAD4W312_PRUDU|nr:hypothetical protein L3X38_025516 [Prunus dulcis]